MELRNINPIGLVDVPILYRQGEPFDQEGVGCLKPAEVFSTTPDIAAQLLTQPSNYEPADDEARSLLADLQKATDPAMTTGGVIAGTPANPPDADGDRAPDLTKEGGDV